MIDINDQMSLISAVEQIKPPATFLVDALFPNAEQFDTETILLEYRKRGREQLAPYVVEGGKGVNVARAGSIVQAYKPPLIAPRRVLTERDLRRRAFGETPVFSTVPPEERQAKLQADDLVDLIGMLKNRQNQQAAEILTTGGITVSAYADDGLLQKTDEIKYEWAGAVSVNKPWSSSDATIFSDLQAMSEAIQEDAGEVPTLLIVGKNVPRYMMNNKELRHWLMVPSRETLTFASFAPQYTGPQVLNVGRLDALNADIVCYAATYTDSTGNLKPFIGENDVVLAIPGRGRQLYAAVTLLDKDERFATYSTQYVPQYYASRDSNTLTLTLYSRCLLAPDVATSWRYAKVAN